MFKKTFKWTKQSPKSIFMDHNKFNPDNFAILKENDPYKSTTVVQVVTVTFYFKRTVCYLCWILIL